MKIEYKKSKEIFASDKLSLKETEVALLSLSTSERESERESYLVYLIILEIINILLRNL